MLTKIRKQMGSDIRHYIFGAEDGLISTLGIVLGVSAGGAGTFATVLAGVAAAVTGATSMAAGDFLSTKSEKEVLEMQEKRIDKFVSDHPKKALAEIRHHYLYKENLNKRYVEQCMKELMKNKKLICHRLKEVRRTVSDSVDKPGAAALEIFSSFIVAAMIPIFPFILMSTVHAQIFSPIMTLSVLFIVGAGKTVFTKKKWYRSGFEMVAIGVSAAIIGYLIGELFGKIY